MEDGMLTFSKFEVIVGGQWSNMYLWSRAMQHNPDKPIGKPRMRPGPHKPELSSHQYSEPHISEPESEPPILVNQCQ